jgi:hypothetical protein
MNEVFYSIGGLKIGIQSDYLFPCPQHVAAFLSEENEVDFRIKILPDKYFNQVGNKKYQVVNKKYIDANWFSVYENDNGDSIFSFIADEVCSITHLFIPRFGNEVEIYIDENLLTDKSISIIETTPFLICFMILLIKKSGIILHSSGVVIDDKGFIFCGKSGSGKTTISNLFIRSNLATVLTDETLILRKYEDSIRIYGSPWKGSGDNIYCNKNCQLNHIYFIYHGKENKISNIDKGEAVSILVKQAFPYFWDKKLMLRSFSLMTEIANMVSCSNLYFLPDESVVSFIMKKEGLIS